MNNISIVTENNDYIINISKKKSIFDKNDYIFTFKILNTLSILIVELKLSLSDMMNIIDNIYAFYEIGQDIMYSLNTFDINNRYTIGLSIIQKDNDNTRDILTIYSSNDEVVNKIVTFEITNSCELLCNIFTELILEDEM